MTDPGISNTIARTSATPVSPARKAAEKLEAAFLSEMLKASGVGKMPEVFGGGAGEDQFASFLRDAQAAEIVRAGGLGLTRVFETQLNEASHDNRK